MVIQLKSIQVKQQQNKTAQGNGRMGKIKTLNLSFCNKN
jgi:hypothetical protein